MKAIVTNDKDTGLGLRIVSEGANDVVLMEMLEVKYPSIARPDHHQGGGLDLTVPLETFEGVSDGGHMLISHPTPIAPGDLAEYNERNTSKKIIRCPTFVATGNGRLNTIHLYEILVNNRVVAASPLSRNRPSQAKVYRWTLPNLVIPPRASVTVRAKNVSNEDATFSCTVSDTSSPSPAKEPLVPERKPFLDKLSAFVAALQADGAVDVISNDVVSDGYEVTGHRWQLQLRGSGSLLDLKIDRVDAKHR